jgi:hypothetical protein
MNEELLLLLKQIKDQWGRETVSAILKKIDSYPIKYKGTLKRSISYEQDKTPDADISFFMADYGKFVDQGVNGTQVNRGSQFNFRQTSIKGVAYHIKPWATSKGIQNSWGVATNIVKKGIKPRPFFDSVIQSRVNVLGEAITEGMAQYMNNQVDRLNNTP